MPKLDDMLHIDENVVNEVRRLSDTELQTYLAAKSAQE